MRDDSELHERDIPTLCERVRMIILAHAAPISRLSRDIDHIQRFDDDPGPVTPQFALMCASPALVPASAQIVELFVRTFGRGLFVPPYSFLLLALAATGPVAAAETMVLHATPVHDGDRLRDVVSGLERIFASHPDVLSLPARGVLSRYMLGQEPRRSGNG